MIVPKVVKPTLLPSIRLDNLEKLPEIAAIYFVLNDKEEVLYIGKTENIKQKWNSDDKQELLEVTKNAIITYFAVASVDILNQIETTLIEWFKPKYNITGKNTTNFDHKP
ncbi:MAG: GIY-YIG nuclease family protein [Mastigocoleus sp. MO_167.B18]|uniref:GIY-YIG nuclease family protein n=1 Tax=Mastigocoleus sp. MO_188.B34 TaxID=3036635 RepID=UPI00262BDF63|nr:GIY-YIG nuclease family protein [Mastigocoleus sp. MO_188.B34]MDJ0693752.1 GIY-YIG nuclease family protein [Mastigocoleus sp. MO_188.B34]MDJ0775171.1 GIY-YIG nuclease family protein [Mastigocoleus sp. MO_167.B18]